MRLSYPQHCAQLFIIGAFREAYKAQLCRPPATTPSTYVCKMALDRSTPRSLYLHDVEAQVYAKSWADKFNAAIPLDSSNQPVFPLITFVDAFVVELAERPGRPLTGFELYIEGDFTKHNNNVGAVVDGLGGAARVASDIANAFSHFTFDKSNRKILICDIQGVGSYFTDPQIHTASGKGFGVGNLGATGIKAFLLRHQCGPACRQVGLQPIVNKDIAVNSESIDDAALNPCLGEVTSPTSIFPSVSASAPNPTTGATAVDSDVLKSKSRTMGKLDSRKSSVVDADLEDVAALLNQFDLALESSGVATSPMDSKKTPSSGCIVVEHVFESAQQTAPKQVQQGKEEVAKGGVVRRKTHAMKWDVDFSDAAAQVKIDGITQGKVPKALNSVFPSSESSTPASIPSNLNMPQTEDNRIESGKGLSRTPDAARPSPTNSTSTYPAESFGVLSVDLTSDTVPTSSKTSEPHSPPRAVHSNDFDFDLSLTPRGQQSAFTPTQLAPAQDKKPNLETFLDDNWDLEDNHIPQSTPVTRDVVVQSSTIPRPQTKSVHLNAADEDLIDSILNDGTM